MTNHIRITTETHTDINQHIVYATIRPTKHTWTTIELDRHNIGSYDTDTDREATALTEATAHHYTHGPQTHHNNGSISAEPTPTTRALIAMKHTTNHEDALTKRGQTIIEQIRAERAMRRAAMGHTKQKRTSLLTDPRRSIFA